MDVSGHSLRHLLAIAQKSFKYRHFSNRGILAVEGLWKMPRANKKPDLYAAAAVCTKVRSCLVSLDIRRPVEAPIRSLKRTI
jgi:hypothetical protein